MNDFSGGANSLFKFRNCALPRYNRYMFIVNYHNIVKDEDYDQYDKGIFTRKAKSAFEKEVESLSKNFEFVSLKQLVESLKKGQVIPKALAFTFDDGYQGVYKFALPVLEAYGTVGSIFVISQYPSQTVCFDFDKLEIAFRISGKGAMDDLRPIKQKIKKMTNALVKEHISRLLVNLGVTEDSINHYALTHPKYKPLSWQELNNASQQGHIIGSHTRTHPSLTRISTTEVIDEVYGSLATIKKNVPGLVWTPFAYPYGTPEDISESLTVLLKKSGYSCALTMLPGRNIPGVDLYQLKRVEFQGDKFIQYNSDTEI